MEFEARCLDDDPRLLEQGYRLRYQVYCIERKFLRVEDYPDGREQDTFDGDSIHVGAVDTDGVVAGTARLVLPNSAGFPLFHHCTLFPDETTLDEAGNLVVEVSRVSISRHYNRRRDDPPLGQYRVSEADHGVAVAATADRRRRRAEPFATLLKAIYHGVKQVGATHVIGATEESLHRWLLHFGLPYRLAGPTVEYYGLVAPYIMSLAEFDEVILGRHFAALDDFPVGLEPGVWPRLDEHNRHVARAGQGAL
ncbi:MAG: PEP-CTERM/exosortase system-associated acyltransferase [Acidobacteriota bacterium]